MSDSDNPKAITSFGKSLVDMPCFRSTFLFSIPSGMVAGFAYFLFTSKSRRAIHVGYFSFFTLSFAYWGYCRYKWSADKFKYDQIQAALKDVNIIDGTQQAEEIRMPDLKSA